MIDSINDFIQQYIDIVLLNRKSKLLNYKCFKQIALSLISEIIVRQKYVSNYNCNNKNIVFQKNKYGKPFLDNSHLFFNISHSNDALVVAFSDKEIGVDIEKVNSYSCNIAKRYFCDNEYRFIVSKQSNRNNRFFDIWTKKEAYIKYLGMGLSKPLNSFNVLSKEFNKHSFGFRIDNYYVSTYSEYELVDNLDINISFLNEKDIYLFAEQLII